MTKQMQKFEFRRLEYMFLNTRATTDKDYILTGMEATAKKWG